MAAESRVLCLDLMLGRTTEGGILELCGSSGVGASTLALQFASTWVASKRRVMFIDTLLQRCKPITHGQASGPLVPFLQSLIFSPLRISANNHDGLVVFRRYRDFGALASSINDLNDCDVVIFDTVTDILPADPVTSWERALASNYPNILRARHECMFFDWARSSGFLKNKTWIVIKVAKQGLSRSEGLRPGGGQTCAEYPDVRIWMTPGRVELRTERTPVGWADVPFGHGVTLHDLNRPDTGVRVSTFLAYGQGFAEDQTYCL